VRFEYDGIQLLRVDERYDSDSSGTITEADSWRALHENSHMPGSLSHLLAKKVYTYASGTTGAPSGSTDYFYAYDPVGNVVAISNGAGARTYAFTQDAWGNELSVGAFTGDNWTTARNAGVWEHQTGKWLDPFTGLYYFHARFYDSKVGRFVGRDPVNVGLSMLRNIQSCSGCSQGIQGKQSFHRHQNPPYLFCANNSNRFVDPSGTVCVDFSVAEVGVGPILWSVGGFVLEFTSSNPCKESRRTCQYAGVILSIGPSTPLDAWIATGTCCNLETCCVNADEVGSRIGGEIGGHLATPIGAGNVNLFSIGEGWDCYVDAMDGGFRGIGGGIEAELSITLIKLGCRK